MPPPTPGPGCVVSAPARSQLAAAGLLDGRRATAHWQHTAQLAARHPKVVVDDSVLYTDEGSVLTSAGATAALDLCLHLVRRDLGADVAGQLARRLVVAGPPRRRSGPVHRGAAATHRRRQPGPGAPVGHRAAGRAADRRGTGTPGADVTSRTFHRKLQEFCGTTPLQWLLQQRIARAQTLLGAVTCPSSGSASSAGSARRRTCAGTSPQRRGLSPTAYRRAFRPSGPLRQTVDDAVHRVAAAGEVR